MMTARSSKRTPREATVQSGQIGWSRLPGLIAVVVVALSGLLGATAIAQTEGLQGLPLEARRILEESQRATSQPGQRLDQTRTRAAEEASNEERIRLLRERAAVEKRETASINRFCQSGSGLDVDLDAFSRLERDYCQRARTSLRLFGYDTFSVVPGDEVLATGAISPNYVLGIGDEFIITFHGRISGTHVLLVDREGRLLVPNMPPLAAAGRTFGEVREEFLTRTKVAFLGTEVFISLGAVRQISVRVVGAVGAPGIHRLTSLATLPDALGTAGGVLRTGSLRSITVHRGGSVVRVDLYGLLTGSVSDDELSLADGDRIHVPPIGATLAIKGAVKRQGIYELPPGSDDLSVDDLLKLSGGTLRPRGHVYTRSGFGPDGGERVVRVSRGFTGLGDGDILQVLTRAKARRGSVELLGHVQVPGSRALSSASTVASLVGGLEALGAGAYLPFAVLETSDTSTGARRLHGVNLRRVLEGVEDFSLRGEDRLFVLSTADVRYLASRDVRRVLSGGPSPSSDCAGLTALADLLTRGAGDRFLTLRQSKLLAGPVAQADETDCPELLIETPGLLSFALGRAAVLQGEVRRPGFYPVTPGTQLSTVLGYADGLAARGATPRAEIARLATPGLVAGTAHRRVVALPADGSVAVTLSPRDLVTILPTASVRLTGQVRSPGMRALVSAPTLRALVGDREVFAADPYLPFSVLITTDPQTRSRRLFPVNLARVLSGELDYSLRADDELVVFGSQDIRYLNSTDVRNVLLERPLPGLTLSESVLLHVRRQSQEEQESQDTTTARETAQEQEREVSLAARRSASADAASLGRMASGDVCSGLKALARVVSASGNRRFDTAIQAGISENALEYDLREDCPSAFERHPELLPAALSHAVALVGEVRRPGAYPVAGRTTLGEMISITDGTTADADPGSVELSRSAGGSGQVALKRAVHSLEDGDVEVLAKDVIRVNARFTDREFGPVVLSGEFVRPGVYTVRRGERLSEVISRAGGLTRQAYPYGSVFTRERVKRAEALALRRAAREVSAALAVVASKSNVKSEQVASLTQLAERLDTAEAFGRVVIEADPTVLQVRPEVDTVLEGGDRLLIPKRPNFITVAGDVLNPSSIQFQSGATVGDYIRRAGGLQFTADDDRIFVVLPNGEARATDASFWNHDAVQIAPGSTIVVPRDPKPFDFVELLKDITPVLSNLAVTAASLAVISGAGN